MGFLTLDVEEFERLERENRELQTEIEKLKTFLKAKCEHEQYAVECISNIETHLIFNEPEKIQETINDWRSLNKKAIKIKSIILENDVKIGNLNWKAGTTLYKCGECSCFLNYGQSYCFICGLKVDWD